MSSSHLDPQGRLRMIDVGGKNETRRAAVAHGRIVMEPSTVEAITGGKLPKGDVLQVAQVAAVLAAKRTPELIPGCHPLRISAVEVTFTPGDDAIDIEVEVRGVDRTGFEMEALTACSIAALTIYDMAKGIDPSMSIEELHLASKTGGKSSITPLDGVRCAVVTVSTGVAEGTREDTGGPTVAAWLTERGAVVVSSHAVTDDRGLIASLLRSLSSVDLVVTTGGTGVSPTDTTPEATLDVADRVVPGLADAMRAASLRVTPHAMISRGVAVIVGSTLVLNVPGSPKAVAESLDAVAVTLPHAIDLLRGGRPH